MNNRKCGACTIDFHGASYAKHLRSKKHIENEKLNEMIIPEWLFHEPIEKKIKKIYNPKTLKQIAMENVKLDDKPLNKEVAKKMNNPDYLTVRNLKVVFKINLESHHINHANSKKTITHNYPEFGIEVRDIRRIIKELTVIYARLRININLNIKQFFKQDLINKVKLIKF